MSQDFTKPNAQLEAQIAAATTKEELDAVLLRYQELNGMPTRFDRVALPSRSGDSSSQPSAPIESSGGTPRYRVIYPHGNARFELEGNSEADLDAQEAKIRAMYGRTK